MYGLGVLIENSSVGIGSLVCYELDIVPMDDYLLWVIFVEASERKFRVYICLFLDSSVHGKPVSLLDLGMGGEFLVGLDSENMNGVNTPSHSCSR